VRRRLRGPRRVKADMLAEVRDGLIDATEAYRDSGLDEDGAQRQGWPTSAPYATWSPTTRPNSVSPRAAVPGC
jgi:hypothetical protein